MSYRKLTTSEIANIAKAIVNKDKLDAARRVIKAHYPSSAYKVIVKANSNYDDEHYDFEPIIIVLSKSCDELNAITQCDASISYALYGDNEYRTDDDNLVDYTFLVHAQDEIPDLYVEE